MDGQLGMMLSLNTLSAHEYCLTFSAGLFNQVEEEEGINGFLESDIHEELKRGSRLYCRGCGKKGATLGCEDKRCKNAYHLPCAIQCHCLLQYFGAFQVFCPIHHIKQVIKAKKSTSFHEEGLRSFSSQEEECLRLSLYPVSLQLIQPHSVWISLLPESSTPLHDTTPEETMDNKKCDCNQHPVRAPPLETDYPQSLLYYFTEPDSTHSSSINCGICLCDIDNKPTFSDLVTPCCANFFHRSCVQRMALSAGKHHFKCPMCGCVDEFQEEMQIFGINLPDRDALWEDGDAYHDLHSIFEECSDANCLCPQGRHFALDDTVLEKEGPSWAMLICSTCGQFGLHFKCCQDLYPDLPCDLESDSWNCPTCHLVLQSMPPRAPKKMNVKLKNLSIHLVKFNGFV